MVRLASERDRFNPSRLAGPGVRFAEVARYRGSRPRRKLAVAFQARASATDNPWSSAAGNTSDRGIGGGSNDRGNEPVLSSSSAFACMGMVAVRASNATETLIVNQLPIVTPLQLSVIALKCPSFG